MKERKHVYFAAGVLALVLMFGAGIVTLVGQDISWAAPSGQEAENALTKTISAEQAEVAGLLPTQEVLSQIYDQVAPSVVSIQVKLNPEATAMSGQQMPDLPFPFPFGMPDQGEEGQGQTPVEPMAEGSGFIYDNDGHIVTNNHVVQDATEIMVYFYNGMWAKAEVVATDPSADLAVLKVTPPAGLQWQPLVLGSDDALRAGYYVVAMGSPFGLDETMTLGVVSALDRSMPTGDAATGTSYSLPDVIQTDTAINPGNSGGPLLNLKGEVVGVNFAINSPVRANAGVGFAIPVSVLNKVVPALINDGEYTYSYLGISGQTIDATVAAENKVNDNTLGVYVGGVVSGGPAESAGVMAGDIITAIDDQPVVRFEDVVSHLFNATAPNQTAKLTVLRDGETITLDVTIAERPAPKTEELATGEGRESGISIAEAIKAAKAAVADSELIQNVESATAKRDTQDGKDVWVVTISGDDHTATVVVDAANGDVVQLDLN